MNFRAASQSLVIRNAVVPCLLGRQADFNVELACRPKRTSSPLVSSQRYRRECRDWVTGSPTLQVLLYFSYKGIFPRTCVRIFQLNVHLGVLHALGRRVLGGGREGQLLQQLLSNLQPLHAAGVPCLREDDK